MFFSEILYFRKQYLEKNLNFFYFKILGKKSEYFPNFLMFFQNCCNKPT